MKTPPKLAVNELEAMMEGGCGSPGCTCRPEFLYLTQRCHPKAGTVTAVKDDILTVSCVQCSKIVAEVTLMGGASKQMRSLNRRLCSCPTLREPGYKGAS